MFLYDLIIGPIELIIDWVFTLFSCKFFHLGPFVNLYVVSMIINYLALPLYNKAEGIQDKTREHLKVLEPMIKHIKKTFKGEEQFIMLSEYYRQNNYHPLSALKGSLSILIEIPFFIAAYHYLSNATVLQNSVFWVFRNLAAPDRLFSISLFSKDVAINVLPIAMTVISIVSSFIYAKKLSTKDKVQVLIMPLIFLVLLYNAPSGIVLYWIVNNLFSLVKNIALKTRFAKEILIASIGFNISVFGALVIFFPETGISGAGPYLIITLGVLIIAFGVMFRFINRIALVNKFKSAVASYCSISISNPKEAMALFFTSGVGLALLSGLLLPSYVISTSPIEFSFLGNTASPLGYIWDTLFIYLGLFLLWPFVIVRIVNNDRSYRGGWIFAILLIFALFNAFVFKSNYGNMDAQFFLDMPNNLKDVNFLLWIGPVLVFIGAFFLVKFLSKKNWINYFVIFLMSICIVESVLGIKNVIFIKTVFDEHNETSSQIGEKTALTPVFNFTKTGKNVVVLFFDRATSTFLLHSLDLIPGLKEQLNGFTFYPNTLSYHVSTIGGSPSMMGGYEYTMEEINKRPEQSLVSKHNESMLVAPQLFKDAGYEITVTDPPFPNYTYYGDLTPFELETLDGIYVEQFDQAYMGRAVKEYIKEHDILSDKPLDETTRAEAPNFSMLQILPPCMRYGFNSYFRNANANISMDRIRFIAPYSSVYYMNELTSFDKKENQYMFIGNNTTHEPTWLDETFTYPVAPKDTAKVNIETKNAFTIISYQAFVAVMKKVGSWLDLLRENGVYDNTRIVIVADHGGWFDIAPKGMEKMGYNPSPLSPLFMYKDFDSNDSLKIDETFMTNADTIFLLKEGLDELSDKNPFTGKKFTQNKDNGINCYDTSFPMSTVFLKSDSVTTFDFDYNHMWHFEGEDIFDRGNWSKKSEL